MLFGCVFFLLLLLLLLLLLSLNLFWGMDAPIASVSAFAPESWIAKLPLAQFNAWSWLWGNAAASTKHINALSLIFLYP